ncbi:opacity protein [Terriglobus roseus DSM 18391]|uniref:Opacity protein n=1 Tax=Terriglobus roseus (strain DSM 18391 / NRRL B-41598 / KBS 63) TaxID=926566 RepID=I3ZAV2_TERRK|nr:outer membrane beta-barrel protein [Terriglobus roseus]AFL86370.1 opacity protein [Terriglobus roseus DSM 18391]
MNKMLLVIAGLGIASSLPLAATAEQMGQSAQPGYPRVLRTDTSWSGFYAGLNLGGGFGNNSIVTTGQVTANVNNVNGGARTPLTSVDRSGIIGGGQIGYDHQFQHFVLGLETDLAGTGISGQRTVVTTALTGGASLNNTFSSNLKSLGTVRGRVGLAAGRVLFYGTGGLAYGSTESSANFFGPSPTNVLQFTANNSSMSTGYAVGGGAEYKMARHLSTKAEYLYYKLEDQTLNVAVIAGSGGGGTGYNTTFQSKGNVLRLGANYRF